MHEQDRNKVRLRPRTGRPRDEDVAPMPPSRRLTCLLCFFSSVFFLSFFLKASNVAGSTLYRHSVHFP